MHITLLLDHQLSCCRLGHPCVSLLCPYTLLLRRPCTYPKNHVDADKPFTQTACSSPTIALRADNYCGKQLITAYYELYDGGTVETKKTKKAHLLFGQVYFGTSGQNSQHSGVLAHGQQQLLDLKRRKKHSTHSIIKEKDWWGRLKSRN